MHPAHCVFLSTEWYVFLKAIWKHPKVELHPLSWSMPRICTPSPISKVPEVKTPFSHYLEICFNYVYGHVKDVDMCRPCVQDMCRCDRGQRHQVSLGTGVTGGFELGTKLGPSARAMPHLRVNPSLQHQELYFSSRSSQGMMVQDFFIKKKRYFLLGGAGNHTWGTVHTRQMLRTPSLRLTSR